MGRPGLRASLRTMSAAVLAVPALLLAGPPAASAAPVFVTVGQTAPAGDALGPTEGGCTTCNAIPYASVTSPGSAFPYDGVLTRWSVRTKTIANPVETVQPRVWRHTAATTSTLVRQGATATLSTPDTVQTFWDRLPAAAGDLLGARFDTGAGVDETAPLFTNGTAAGDVAVRPLDIPAVAVGGTATAPGVANRRVNIAARFERDEDQDGYGDGSQDLCPGDAAHTTGACSGALFGSDLQGPYKRVGFTCTFECVRVQRTTAGGTSTAPTADGVVVRWRLQGPNAGVYRIRIVAPAGDGFVLAATSDPVTVGPDEALQTIPARLSIPAGGYVALLPPTFTVQTSLVTPPAGATYALANDGGDGGPATFSAATPGVVMYDADIEPDADHDGFGDVTQDACPSDATTQGTCPVVVPPGGPAGPTPPSGATPPAPAPTGITPPVAIAPRITALRLSRTRFRVDRRGAVLARATPAGATFLVTLTDPARVRFTIRRLTGAKATTVHTATRTLAKGATRTRYSGRYRHGGAVRTLRPGRYRLDAAVLSASGRPGPVTSRRFTVVR